MVLMVMLQRWQLQRWDSSGRDSAEITMCDTSLTGMATDRAVTALLV